MPSFQGDWSSTTCDHTADAQTLVGLMYTNRHGVPQDYAQALIWYRKAAEQRDARAQFGLGLM